MKCSKKVIILFLLLVAALSFSGCGYVRTETDDLADYGVIKGNVPYGGDEVAKKNFEELFPKAISPSFQDVHYHYSAGNIEISYDIFLEFVIPEEDDFIAYVESIAPLDEFHPFEYDVRFIEYLVPGEFSNFLCLSHVKSNDSDHRQPKERYMVEAASIQRIMIDINEHRVIIDAMKVSDGGGTELSEVDAFFRRFNIDPIEFADDVWEN